MRKNLFIVKALVMLFSFFGSFMLISCRISGSSDFHMNEPVFKELSSVNQKPVFTLSWTKHPKTDHYEIAFYAEGEDSYGRGSFAIRSTSWTYEGKTSKDTYFLQGVHTDTVRYRMKVRPVIGVDAWTDPKDYIWSNIWEINFVDGQYTVKETTEDFDEEIAKTNEEKKASATPTPTARKAEPLKHSLPESFLTYMAKERGKEEPFDKEEIAAFSVTVTYCEYAEQGQLFTEARPVSLFREALSKMTVKELIDSESSTEGGVVYSALDSRGNTLFVFGTQRGMLDGRDGHYAVDGIEELEKIDEIMFEEDWADYWEQYGEKKDSYEDSLTIKKGMSLLDAAGYGTHRMKELGAKNFIYADAYIDWIQDVPTLYVRDHGELKTLYDILSSMKILEEDSAGGGQMWHMNFSFTDENEPVISQAWIEFKGDCVKIDGECYKVEGIEKLYDSIDCELFTYLKDYSYAPRIKPSY